MEVAPLERKFLMCRGTKTIANDLSKRELQAPPKTKSVWPDADRVCPNRPFGLLPEVRRWNQMQTLTSVPQTRSESNRIFPVQELVDAERQRERPSVPIVNRLKTQGPSGGNGLGSFYSWCSAPRRPFCKRIEPKRKQDIFV